MIRRLLVANRGEAARRVLASCRRVGIESVAVYADPDAGSPHVQEADRAVRLPGTAPTATYLRGDLLLAAARRTGADAVHPGWGMLAADPDFAAAVTERGLGWVGPPPKVLAALRAQPVGQPPSGSGPLRRLDIPVLVDSQGEAVALCERDCSVRRGGQVLLAESPSAGVSPALRAQLSRTAVDAVTALGYHGAATVSLAVAGDGEIRVCGVDPQLSPEHAVTECVTGVDLVRWQLLVTEQAIQPALAAPFPLPATGAAPVRGHVLAGRLYAEDPADAWRPSGGVLHRFGFGPVAGEFTVPPGPGLRLDAGLGRGAEASARYGSSLATLTAWAPGRSEASRQLASALAGARIHGVRTNRDLLVRALRHPDFLAGGIDTGFLPARPELLAPLMSSVDIGKVSCLAAALATAVARRAAAHALPGLASGWRNVPSGAQSVVYEAPMGTTEIGYRLDRTGELEYWWVRTVEPDELDLAGLGQPTSRPDDRPAVAIESARPDLVVLDVAGVRLPFAVHQVEDIAYVDSPEGAVELRELPRYLSPAPVDEAPG